MDRPIFLVHQSAYPCLLGPTPSAQTRASNHIGEAVPPLIFAIAKLPIFRHYDPGDALHPSSDGQKFETSIHPLNARHSSIYFGLKKGVVSYTLVATNIPINAYIIGARKPLRVRHPVQHTTDIQPEIHSTDPHGANEVNFALLHLFGHQFAPRYKDLYDKSALRWWLRMIRRRSLR